MKKIPWNHDLHMGITFIDDHHKKLIHIANEFIDAAHRGHRPRTLTHLMTQLREHTVSHLETEETIMTSVRYDKRSIHALKNERLKVVMKGFHKRLCKAEEVTVKDIQLLKKSLLHHIKDSNHAMSKSMELLDTKKIR